MLGKTILLCTDDRAAAKRLAGHLRGAGNEVLIAQAAHAAADLTAAGAVDLVLVDASAAHAGDVLDAAKGRAPAVVISARAEPTLMLDFVCEREVEHFLARDGEADGSLDDLGREVVVTAEKILRADLFGIEKYLPAFGVELSVAEVRGATDRDGIVECLKDHVEWLGGGREAALAVTAIADELITNAVYDAPRDAGGRARYHATDRREKVQLEPWEYVQVRWGSDGDVLAIAVTDWFGALRPEHIRNGLRRCLTAGDQIEQKAGGAGLGLYTALAYATQLVINVDRGQRTEIIALVDLRRRKGARRAGASLHLFFDDSRARTAEATDATPASVVVAESLLVELRERLAPVKKKAPEVVALVQPKRRSQTVQARGSVPPPAGEPVGAGTACGLLRGAKDAEMAVRIGLRFLAQHYEAAVAYRVGVELLEPHGAEGLVRDWTRLRELQLSRDGIASLAQLALEPHAVVFQPRCPMDSRLAMLATGDSDAQGVVVPLQVAGDLRWVLWGSSPREDTPLTPASLEQVRAEIEKCLHRVDPEEPVIEVDEMDTITKPMGLVRG